MRILVALAILVLTAVPIQAQGTPKKDTGFPKPAEGTYLLRDFHFAAGQALPEVKMHYYTFGQPRRDDKGVVRNAVLILHGTTGSGKNFLNKVFAGELFNKGQPLDVTRYYVIIPDNLGHGASTKPSDGLHARFPSYGYRDMIHAQHQLLTDGLKVNHLRLVMGTSMGGMHTWLWGEMYPDYMDALLPLASLPGQISGRNRIWRRMVIDTIRNDPEWKKGEYKTQPPSLRLAGEMIMLMSSNPNLRQKEMPTLARADKLIDKFLVSYVKKSDANDVLYAVQASFDYDPGPDLGKIKAPLLAINFADDLINPPELGILDREIKRVPRGKAIVMPQTDKTKGHGTHTLAAVWKNHLLELLKESAPAGPGIAAPGPRSVRFGLKGNAPQSELP
jgi:homoserine O-acetyltransferase